MSEDPETPDSDPDLVADADADGTSADETDDADDDPAESGRSDGSTTGNDAPDSDADGWTARGWRSEVVDADGEAGATGGAGGTGDEGAETGGSEGDGAPTRETGDERAGTGGTGSGVGETAGAADEATEAVDAADETAETADADGGTAETADADGWSADVWTAEVVDPDDETSGAVASGDDASATGGTEGEGAETTDSDDETGGSAGAAGVTAESAAPDGVAAETGDPDGEVAAPTAADAPAVEDPTQSDEAPSVTPEPTGSVAGTETVDGAVESGGEGAGDPPPDDVTFADFGRGGPEDDVEMPLADHIEEMIRRLGIVFLIGGVVAIAVFPLADGLINYLWNSHIPGAATIADRRPRLYGPLELLVTELKVAGLSGLIAGLPALVYQSYRFMRPGLYPNERRYYLAAVPTSLVLATVGVSFAHFVVLPAIFAYFTSYTTGTALVAFGLRETFNLILLLMGYMAVVFQIPLFIMLAIMMGLATRRSLEDKRLLFWGGFAGLSFLVSPDPTGMAPIIVTATMIALFEGTLALLRWTGN